MMKASLLLVGFLSGNAMASSLRSGKVDLAADTSVEFAVEHLDLEVMVEGKRQLFPLLPGTKCPTGHTCRARAAPATGMAGDINPLIPAMKGGIKTSLSMSLDWIDLNKNLNTVVNSDSRCNRRNAMKRAAALASGVAAVTVASPAFAAETKEVKMGADSGLLVFEPAKISICKGDSVKWINNKAGPHNVVFDEDNIPSGVDQEKISMVDEQLGEPGESFTMKFDTAGTYGYYCEPHRGAGMQGTMTVA
jgi:plastocyanin